MLAIRYNWLAIFAVYPKGQWAKDREHGSKPPKGPKRRKSCFVPAHGGRSQQNRPIDAVPPNILDSPMRTGRLFGCYSSISVNYTLSPCLQMVMDRQPSADETQNYETATQPPAYDQERNLDGLALNQHISGPWRYCTHPPKHLNGLLMRCWMTNKHFDSIMEI